MRQVITFKTDGSIEGLQHKKGKGLDLRKFGKAHIERASTIDWNDDSQKWCVNVVGHGILTTEDLIKSGYTIHHTYSGIGELVDASRRLQIAFFDDYDEAVQAEVAFLNAVRLGVVQ